MSYSEAVTRNDLMGILNNIGYAKDDWTVPNITKNKAGNTEYTTTGGSPKTIMSISHHTNTGRFVILSRAVIKTSRYTSSATLYVDGNYVDSTGYNTTNLTTPVTVNPCGVFTGERDKTYTIELKIDAQDSGTTATALAYNPAQLIAIDILSTQSKGSRILECYPVGSYYETSDANFNPNTAWGGTWVLETKCHNIHTCFGDNNGLMQILLRRNQQELFIHGKQELAEAHQKGTEEQTHNMDGQVKDKRTITCNPTSMFTDGTEQHKLIKI